MLSVKIGSELADNEESEFSPRSRFSGAAMILSHKHKFIFIKTNKTAGTSIEIALSKFCGEDDIITPVAPEDEISRRKLGYRGPQHYRAPLADYGWRDYRNLAFRFRPKRRYYNHMTSTEVRQFVGEDVWNSYYKFCFERNPFDRLVSLYYWRNRKEPRQSISKFLESGFPVILKKYGYHSYTMDGRVVVDKVCRYESLRDELEGVRRQLGIPEALELPRAKASYRKDRRSYRELLTEGDKVEIARMFRSEIELFNYQY